MLQDRTQERIKEQSSMSSPADDSSDGSQNPTSFQYTPLEPSDSSIRLVVLESHKRPYMYNQEIRCRIVRTTFGAKPKYEALSYTWGTELSKKHIKMNGHRFHVSSNLFDALLNLGNLDVERTFWIDAICINQKDIDERNSQIQLMPFIYKRAETVVVWLGGDLDRLFDLRESEYWKRLWVIQEVAKARKLIVSWVAMDNLRCQRTVYRVGVGRSSFPNFPATMFISLKNFGKKDTATTVSSGTC
jgi:Heterokaryon incompatibility protein (HET)